MQIAERADAPQSAIAILAVTLRRQIILKARDRVGGHGAIPSVAIISAQTIDALLRIVAMAPVREVTDIALVFANIITAARTIPSPIILPALLVKDAAGIRRKR